MFRKYRFDYCKISGISDGLFIRFSKKFIENDGFFRMAIACSFLLIEQRSIISDSDESIRRILVICSEFMKLLSRIG